MKTLPSCAYSTLYVIVPAALVLILSDPVLAQTLEEEACKFINQILELSKLVRNAFIVLSVLILIFLGVAGYTGRFKWQHLSVLGGSVGLLAVAHFVPPYFFDASECTGGILQGLTLGTGTNGNPTS